MRYGLLVLDTVLCEALGIAGLLLFSAFFSGTETVLTSLTSLRALQTVEETGRHKAILTRWVEHWSADSKV